MKFVIADGKLLKNRLRIFPTYYQFTFSSSPILVLYITNDNEVVAACGISNISNYTQYYVREEYRGRRLGTMIVAKACGEARKRGLAFVAAAVDLWNRPSLTVAANVGFREIARLETYGYVIMMAPLNLKGKLLYTVLNAICSKLPKIFLHYIIICLMSIVGTIRQVPSTE